MWSWTLLLGFSILLGLFCSARPKEMFFWAVDAKEAAGWAHWSLDLRVVGVVVSSASGEKAAADGGGSRDGDAPVGAAATQGRAVGCAVLRGGARFQRKRLLREKGLIPSPSVIDSTFAAKQKHALLRLGAPRLITIRLLASKSGF